MIARCVSKGAIRQKWIFSGILTALRRQSVLASSHFSLPVLHESPTGGEWAPERRHGAARRVSGQGSFPEAQSCTDRLWPTQTVSVCKFNMRTFYFFKANVFILLAIVSIVAFRIRWFNILLQRSWGGFVYLFVVKSLTSWSDIYTTPRARASGRSLVCHF